MRGLATVAVLLLVTSAGCRTKEPEAPVGVSTKPGAAAAPTGPASFEFDSLDERPVSSLSTQGKPTVVAIVTTGDIVCQAQVDFLVAMAKNDGVKVNYVLVALHPRRELVLVETYRKTLGVTFPTALADPGPTSGPSGPFGEISAVPTMVVLDRSGRIVWKHTGLAKSEELRAHMHGL